MNMNMTYAELERIAFIAGSSYKPLALLADYECQGNAANDAQTHIQDAKGSYPAEDFLQEVINDLLQLAKGRVTKAEVLAIAERLEELQTQVYQSSEYGINELVQAERPVTQQATQ